MQNVLKIDFAGPGFFVNKHKPKSKVPGNVIIIRT